MTSMEQDTLPNEGYCFDLLWKEKEKQTRTGKDPNADTFCGDMSYYIEKSQAKEQIGIWEPNLIIAK